MYWPGVEVQKTRYLHATACPRTPSVLWCHDVSPVTLPDVNDRALVISNIQRARAAAGLSKTQLAHQIDKTPREIRRWEKDVRPSWENIVLLAEALNQSPYWFLQRHDEDDAQGISA
jgi:DNA-binding XRE family transcriptional regulator